MRAAWRCCAFRPCELRRGFGVERGLNGEAFERSVLRGARFADLGFEVRRIETRRRFRAARSRSRHRKSRSPMCRARGCRRSRSQQTQHRAGGRGCIVALHEGVGFGRGIEAIASLGTFSVSSPPLSGMMPLRPSGAAAGSAAGVLGWLLRRAEAARARAARRHLVLHRPGRPHKPAPRRTAPEQQAGRASCCAWVSPSQRPVRAHPPNSELTNLLALVARQRVVAALSSAAAWAMASFMAARQSAICGGGLRRGWIGDAARRIHTPPSKPFPLATKPATASAALAPWVP